MCIVLTIFEINKKAVMKTTNKPVLIFDVNETLLDMDPLKKAVNALLNEPQGFRIWFGMLLHYSTVSNTIADYQDFTKLAVATLQMTARSLHIKVTEHQVLETLSVNQSLQAYPDVIKGLKLLSENGFRLETLTNSPEMTLKKQIKNSQLTSYFERLLSVDAIEKYKPAKETYLWAAAELAVSPNEMLMVAAHGWDIAGASHAGLATCFVARKGQSMYPLAAAPDYWATDILDLAQQLVAEYS